MITLEQRHFIFAALCAVAFPAHGQTSFPDTTHTIQGVTVEARRLSEQVKASTPVQELSYDEMRRMGVGDVGEALKHLAGVQVKDYGGIGGLKTIDVRGLGAQHTGVTYDGVEVGDCQTGQVDLSRFTLEGISRVALVIGQAEDIYLSAKSYASAARVDVTSAFAKIGDSGHPMLAATFKTGAYGFVNPTVFYGQSVGRLAWSAFADYTKADGNYRFKLRNGSQLINAKRNNSDITSWRGEMNMRYSLGGHQRLAWKLYGFNSPRGLPGAVIYDNPYAAERLTDKNIFAQVQYENIFSPRLKFKAAAKWNYSWNRYTDHDAVRSTEDKYRQNETYITATLWTEPLKDFHLSLSQDYAHNYLSMTIVGCPYPSRESFWTALAANYDGVRNVTLNASLLYTGINEHVKVGEPSDGYHRLSPAFSVQWHPLSPLRLRLGFKDIFRTPTLNDLYYTGVGRRTLRPEKTRQWFFGATGSLAFSRSWASFTADSYYGRVTDKIVAVPRMFLWSMMNVSTVRMLGLDVTLSGGVDLGVGFKVNLLASYGYLSATDRTNHADMQYGDQIAYTPRHTGSASLTMHMPWLDITYNLFAVSERYFLGYNIRDNRMPGYADHSFTLTRMVKIRRSELRFQLDAMNLVGHNYEVVRFYPMPGRNIKFTIGYTLK